ncbi:MAG: rhodanese-like domain-containing protein [bacterium]|nr:rhodanese-like domain-containing protein [bacterium]MDT8395919.1 rhodanese-like domain-containing protein [bacterium]
MGYNYMAPADLKARMESSAPMTVVDIQVKEEFDQHHIKGALATYAYPVKSEMEKTRLDTVLDQIASGSGPVVIVCPRAGGGAQRAFDYLAGNRRLPPR